MIGALKILISPNSSFIQIFNELGKKIILRQIVIIFQYVKSMFVDMSMNLALRFYDDFFEWIQNPESRFQDSVIYGFQLYDRNHSFCDQF